LVGEVVRGKALAHVLESAKVVDESGREVDLEALREDAAPLVVDAESVAASDDVADAGDVADADDVADAGDVADADDVADSETPQG
jgi:trigger factor